MKVKLLFTYLLVSFSMIMHAQEAKSSCNFEYTIQAEKNTDEYEINGGLVNFKWDISKIDPSDMISIEIVKIFDCPKGIDGVQTESYTLLNLKSEDLINKNSFEIKHVEMIAKCFKWRDVLKSDTCQEKTNWNYYSYID